MGFDKLERQLRVFFETEASRGTRDISRVAVKESAMREFSRHQKGGFLMRLRQAKWVHSAVVGAIILSLVPFVGSEKSAGELNPSGLVEVVRDGNIFIATEKTPLKIGDQILVGNNASAEIQMSHAMKTIAGNHTQLRITKPNALFLVRGNLMGDFTESSTIATDRGQISGEDASLYIAVSETGETHIQPQLNNIHVTTWDNQKTILVAGEELRLHTDVVLPLELPANLRLSSAQVIAIRSKLLIARTKALNALESRLNKDVSKSKQELISADRSFRSVVQVLKSSRNLEIVRRENLDLVSRKSVVERIIARSSSQTLVAETRAVESLLNIIESNQTQNFPLYKSDSQIFDRYVLLQRLFAPLDTSSRAHGNLLRQQYVEAMGKQIKDSLNGKQAIEELLRVLPNNSSARNFLQSLVKILPPSLSVYLKDFI